MPKIKKPQTLVKWGHEDVTMLELFKELKKLICDPVRNLHDMDGDMYMSDYHKLSEAEWKILSSLRLLEGNTND